MPRHGARDLTVGAVVVLGLLMLAVGIMAVGEGTHLFSGKIQYKVVFPNTDGLKVGSPVSMTGVDLGSVTGIRLPIDPEVPGIEVTLDIAKVYAPRFRENSQATLRYLNILSREKYVEITPGDPSLPELAEHAVIPPQKQIEFLEQGADIAENIDEITVALKGILEPLERGEGLLGEMIHNPDFGKVGMEALRDVLEDLGAITGQIQQGKGFLGRMIYDEQFASTLDHMSTAMEDFAGVMESINKNEGAIGAFLEEDGTGQQAIGEMRDAAASLNRTAQRLESTDNLMGKLLNDQEYSEQLANDLQNLVRNLREISDKINSGQGTLGAFVEDRTVYDGMEEIVAGVNDSKFARWLMRHYRKKGIKAEQNEEEKSEAGVQEP